MLCGFGSILHLYVVVCFFFKQKTAYDRRISDWISDVCSSDLDLEVRGAGALAGAADALSLDGIGALANAGGIGEHDGITVEVHPHFDDVAGRPRLRSEERRVGQECGSTGRSWWSPYQSQKIKTLTNQNCS